MKTPVRIALIGVGGVGQVHYAAIDALAREGRVRLVAVADPTVGGLAETRAALQVRGVRWHLRYEDLLRDEEALDAVTIATPIPCHFEMARACIRRGLFVNLEKPPVPFLHQLETLISEDVENRVSIGFQMIGSKLVQRMKQVVVEGALGKVHAIRAGGCWPRTHAYYNRAPWAGRMALRGEPVFDGPATNALAHVIHNIMFLASPEPGGYNAPATVRGELYRARRIESYDTACLRGEFASGTTFSVALTHATEDTLPFRIKVHGSKGWARLGANGSHLETSEGLSLQDAESFPEGIERCYQRFVDFVTGSQPRTDTSLRDARGYLLATNGMLLSSGGIRDIDASFINPYAKGDDGGYNVAGLVEAVAATLESGSLFSELSVPWAVPTDPVDVSEVRCGRYLDVMEGADEEGRETSTVPGQVGE